MEPKCSAPTTGINNYVDKTAAEIHSHHFGFTLSKLIHRFHYPKKFPRSLLSWEHSIIIRGRETERELTTMASAILMVALVSSRIFWIRQPSLPMTFPICRDGTIILNITSCATALLFTPDSSAKPPPSSRRRFKVDGFPSSAENPGTEAGAPARWTKYGEGVGMWGMLMGISRGFMDGTAG